MNTTEMTETPSIKVAAALILDAHGRTLLVRKRGTDYFMQAGGKIEGNEDARTALGRELEEELGLPVDKEALEYLGRYIAPAANEEGFMVDAEMYHIEISGDVSPAAEIEEIAWVSLSGPIHVPLAPLTRDKVLPMARERLELS